jgi:hypothetical protein
LLAAPGEPGFVRQLTHREPGRLGQPEAWGLNRQGRQERQERASEPRRGLFLVRR